MSVTTVPIPPIAKSTLAKLWVGILLLVIVSAALAYVGVKNINARYSTNEVFLAENTLNEGVETTKSGLQIQVIKAGEGPSPKIDDVALVGYKGTLRDGTVFDENPQAQFPVGGVIPGFSEALQKMQRGGEYKIWIPSDLAYGPEAQINRKTGEVFMPAASLLTFEVSLFDFRTQAEVEEIRKQAEQAQGGAGGPPGSAPGGLPQGLPPELQAQLEQQLRGAQ